MKGAVKVTAKLDIGPLAKKFRAMDKAARTKMGHRATEEGALVVQAYARVNATRVLNIHPTGALANSIIYEVKDSGTLQWEAEIGPTVVYGAIHEFGGIIRPRNAKLLHWVDESGQHHYAKAVHMPARPYMRPALFENQDQIVNAIGKRISLDLAQFEE